VFLFPWYVTLCLAQGALVMIPVVGKEPPNRRLALLGLLGPAAAMVIGVGLVVVVGDVGANLLTWLGTVVTPVLAASLGWLARWRRPALTAIVAAILYVIAWRAGGHAADLAAMLLVGGASLAIAAFVGRVTPARYLALGLIGLVVLDVVLVFRTTHVATTTWTLYATQLPEVGVGRAAHRLPALQHVAIGDSIMGWLDFVAPALLSAVVGWRARARILAGVVVAITAILFGLLLHVTSKLPATVPVLAGLGVTWRDWWDR
jgi:hypothetical protein